MVDGEGDEADIGVSVAATDDDADGEDCGCLGCSSNKDRWSIQSIITSVGRF